MFYGCTNLKYIDMSQFLTIKLEYMDRMFYNCQNVQFLNINNFHALNLKSAQDVFYGVISPINLTYHKEYINSILQVKIDNLTILNK